MSLSRLTKLARLPILLVPLAVLAVPSESRTPTQAPKPTANLIAVPATSWASVEQARSDDAVQRVADLACARMDFSDPGAAAFRTVLAGLEQKLHRVVRMPSAVEYTFEYDPETGRWYIYCHETMRATVVESDGEVPVILELRVDLRFD